MSTPYNPSPYRRAVRAIFDVQDSHASRLKLFDTLVSAFVNQPNVNAARALIHWLYRTPGTCHVAACQALYAYIDDVEFRGSCYPK
jgi:hypothetical protein